MKRWEWGIGIGVGIGIGNRESGAVSGQPIADSRDWGLGVGNGEWGLGNNEYKKSCEKMVIIFSQPFFTYPISW